jgi:hypothetical protein
MKNQAIDILKTFSNGEIKEFEVFINSPFHNKNSKVISFFKLLKPYHPTYDSKKLNKEDLFKKLSGETGFKESYIRNLFSDLNILLENYLRQINFRNSHNYHINLIEESLDRGLIETTQKKAKLF